MHLINVTAWYSSIMIVVGNGCDRIMIMRWCRRSVVVGDNVM